MLRVRHRSCVAAAVPRYGHKAIMRSGERQVKRNCSRVRDLKCTFLPSTSFGMLAKGESCLDSDKSLSVTQWTAASPYQE
jgi:hypothetical protein